MFIVMLALTAGCNRATQTSQSEAIIYLEKELFHLNSTQLFARGITEVDKETGQSRWMLANYMDADTNSAAHVRALFQKHDIVWDGSGNLGMWAVYVPKKDFPRAQALLMECKEKNGLNLRVWHPEENKEEIDEWMSNNQFQAIDAKASKPDL